MRQKQQVQAKEEREGEGRGATITETRETFPGGAGEPLGGAHTAPCSHAWPGSNASRHWMCFSELLDSSAFADTSEMLSWVRSQDGLRLPPAALGRCLFLHKVLVAEECFGGDGGDYSSPSTS